jgi:hypothetical protein
MHHRRVQKIKHNIQSKKLDVQASLKEQEVFSLFSARS